MAFNFPDEITGQVKWKYPKGNTLFQWQITNEVGQQRWCAIQLTSCQNMSKWARLKRWHTDCNRMLLWLCTRRMWNNKVKHEVWQTPGRFATADSSAFDSSCWRRPVLLHHEQSTTTCCGTTTEFYTHERMSVRQKGHVQMPYSRTRALGCS